MGWNSRATACPKWYLPAVDTTAMLYICILALNNGFERPLPFGVAAGHKT